MTGWIVCYNTVTCAKGLGTFREIRAGSLN